MGVPLCWDVSKGKETILTDHTEQERNASTMNEAELEI